MRHHQSGFKIWLGIWLTLGLVVLSVWVELTCILVLLLLLLIGVVFAGFVVDIEIFIHVLLIPLLLDLA